MTALTPDEIRSLDAHAWARFEKRFSELSDAERQLYIAECRTDTTRLIAEADRMEAAIKDARRCGCPIAAPRRTDDPNRGDIGRAWVNHQCGGGSR